MQAGIPALINFLNVFKKTDHETPPDLSITTSSDISVISD
jgi:hypothetical protein